jgi:hypothetical protein
VPQTRQDVVRHAVARARVVHVVGDDPRHVERARDLDEARGGSTFFRKPVIPALDRDAPVEDVEQCGRGLARRIGLAARRERRDPAARATGEREQARRVRRELVERDARRAAHRGVAAREGDQGGEVGVAVA